MKNKNVKSKRNANGGEKREELKKKRKELSIPNLSKLKFTRKLNSLSNNPNNLSSSASTNNPSSSIGLTTVNKSSDNESATKESNSMRDFGLNATLKSSSYQELFDKNSQEINSQNDSLAQTIRKDDSRKAYYKEFNKVVEQADVILEIIDARDPQGTRSTAIEETILSTHTDKKIIIILNKIDLIPKEALQAWLKYLRNYYPTIAFKASTQEQRHNLGQSTVSATQATQSLLNSSESLGADTLVKLLKNYCRNCNLKTSITVGVIGFPNVGKSSVINSLKRSKVCGVGSTPGLTKVAQVIQLDKNIKLLDCPGIIFSTGTDAQVQLRNCIKVELIIDPIALVQVILSKTGVPQLQHLYTIDKFDNVLQLLTAYSIKRGRLLKGGRVDLEASARCIIQDWNNGRIPFYSLPPTIAGQISTSIVSNWASEFDLDSYNSSDINSIIDFDVGSTIGAMDTIGNVNVNAIDADNNNGGMDDISTANNIGVSAENVDVEMKPLIVSDISSLKFKDIVAKQVAMIHHPSPIFNAEELALIPQRTRALKMEMKKSRKDARRGMKADDIEMA